MPRSIQHHFIRLLAVFAVFLLGLPSALAQIKVACVGDSITAGYGLSNWGTESYPAQLQALLGSGYTVQNYGDSGRTLMKNTGYSYWDSWAYTSSMAANPDIVVIMLGTNDTKAWNWSPSNFSTDYNALIAAYQALPSQPTVYVCLAPPAYANTMDFNPAFIQNNLLPAIQGVATSNGQTLIDNNTPLLNHEELFSDGVHPTAQGATVIASTVADVLTSGQGPTLQSTGSVAPVPGPNDISQLSTQGNQSNPDGLNYFTDNYVSWGNGEPGQTFTTGANAGGYVLTSLALKTGGIGSSSGTTTPQPYHLHIYSLSGNTATLLQTYTSGDVAFNDGNWLQWTGLSVSLSPNATYAFSFGKASSTSSWATMAVATNQYPGGELAQIKPNTGGVTYGSSHTFDAVFNLGLALATTPTVSSILVSPTATVPAGVATTFTASVAGALPMSYQWQFDDGGGFVDLPGANSTTLSFTAAVADTGSYRLVLTNSYGTVTSAPVALAVSPRVSNIPDSMPFPLPTYGMNIGNKLELNWGAPNPAVLYNAAYNGFNAVRVPCAWSKNSTTSVVDGVTRYLINPSYMAQVKQTVDAAIDAGLYVVINCHADDNWLEKNVTTSIDPIVDAKMKDFWTQIATTFAGYDNHLLFAAANEPDVDSQDKMKVLVYYYQTFVNAVRAAGGNNTNRWLVLPSVSDPTWMNALPTDTVPNRLMVEYHNYTPSLFSIIHTDQSWGTAIYFWGKAYNYAGNPSRNATWGEENETDAGYQQLADLYVSKGIPVMIGEFGASPSGLTDPTEKAYNVASVLYWDKYLADSARAHGLSPFYWSTGGDPFDYDTAETKRPDIIAAVTGGTVPPPPNGSPYAASDLTATGGAGQITLSWTAGSGATSYNLYRATTSGGGSKIAPVVTGITGTSYTDTGLATGATYYYQVVAVNASGMSGFSPEVRATTSGSIDTAQFNFESNTQSWSGGGGMISGVATSTAQHFAGNQSLAVNFAGTAGGTSSVSVRNVAITPGTTITFRVWIPSGSTITALQPYLLDQNWSWADGWYENLTVGSWNTMTLTVPSSAVSPLQVLGVQFITNAAWTGICYIDSVSWPAAGPDFSLAASPTSLIVTGGTSGTSMITVTPLNSLNAAYTLSVDNLPAGVSAEFAQDVIIGGSSQLAFTASNSVSPGTTEVSITATAGLLSHSTTIALTLEAATPLAEPSALYAFEGDAQDSSGSGNHGTATAITYVAGKIGAQAAQFNGTSSYVSIPRSVTDDFTVMMWVKTTDYGGSPGAQWWAGKGLVDGEVGGGGADWGTALVDGKFVIGVGSTNGDTTLASSVNINDGAWHHVAATRNNATGAITVYVDGVLRGSGTGPTGSRTLPPGLRIGSLQPGYNFLNGTIDDVRIYDHVLADSEIAAFVNTPPELASIGDYTVNVGQTVEFIASGTDGDQPPQGLSYTLLAGPANAALDSNSGAFSFRPLVTQAGTTIPFTLEVSDDGSPPLTATRSFSVTVNPLVMPTIGNMTFAGGQISLQVNGQTGPDYRIETSTNLTDWTPVHTANSPAMPFSWTDTDPGDESKRFYRVKVGPPMEP